MKIIAVFTGRFHPFHKGHAYSFKQLANKFGVENTLLAISSKQEQPDSPFTPQDRAKMAQQLGIPSENILIVRNPYKTTEYADYLEEKGIDPTKTALVFGVSEKDMLEDPRFSFEPTKSGKPSYFQPYTKENAINLQPMTKGQPNTGHAYIVTTDVLDFPVAGKNMRDASTIRRIYAVANQRKKLRILSDLYGDAGQDMKQIFDNNLQITENVRRLVNTIKPLLAEATIEQKIKFIELLSEAKKKMNHSVDDVDTEETLSENLHQWFKEKWVRFGPDGKISGDCARGSDSEGKPKCLPQKKAQALGKKGRKYAASKKRREDPNPDRRGKAHNVATKKKSNESLNSEVLAEKWSEKYKRSIDCSHPKGFSQKAHCQGRKKHNESIEMEMICPECNMCESHANGQNIEEACWKGYHKEGNKKMFDKTYPNCVKNTNEEMCPECGGEMVSEELMNEKKDACYYKVKSRYKVWPSAYASGALVQCRKKGAKNWGNKTNEAASSAQQAAIAINMKKHHKKPKNESDMMESLGDNFYLVNGTDIRYIPESHDLELRDVGKIVSDDEFEDFYNHPEFHKTAEYARQHYPSAPSKQQAFLRFVMNSLRHSKEDDEKQDKDIDLLMTRVNSLDNKVEKLSKNVSESSFDWSDYKFIENMDTRLDVVTSHFNHKMNLTEANDPDMTDYFLKLKNMSDNVSVDEKCIVVCLLLLNNKVDQIQFPEIGTLLKVDNGIYHIKRASGVIDTYPKGVERGKVSFITLLFNKISSYEKLRNIIMLKFDSPLPDPVLFIDSKTNIEKTDNIEETSDYLSEK